MGQHRLFSLITGWGAPAIFTLEVMFLQHSLLSVASFFRFQLMLNFYSLWKAHCLSKKIEIFFFPFAKPGRGIENSKDFSTLQNALEFCFKKSHFLYYFLQIFSNFHALTWTPHQKCYKLRSAERFCKCRDVLVYMWSWYMYIRVILKSDFEEKSSTGTVPRSGFQG